jgi:hypothetical protein
VRLVLGAVAVAALAVGATTTARPLPSLTCAQAIDVPGAQPPPADALVLNRVRLPRPGEVLQLGPAQSPGGARFAKRGLSVTAGAPVVLEVPRRYRRVYGLDFGGGGGRLGNRAVRIRPCPAYAKAWTTWAGGYVARKPVCVELVVRADGRATRIPLNIGRSCARIAR